MRLLALAVCSAALAGCSSVYAPRQYVPSELPSRSAVHGNLKVHLMSGGVVLLDAWQQEATGLTGTGTRYDIHRAIVGTGQQTIPIDSIALIESEVQIGSRYNALPLMTVWTVIWGVVTAACVADPKSCFGSCPTFYLPTDSGEVLVAEGFSASIARVLEEEDLDALFPAHFTGGEFILRMRNEALETHAVRRLTLWAAPKPKGGRVLADPAGRLFSATALRAPVECRAEEGDCLAPLLAPDGLERLSPADSADLAAKETVELVFPEATGRLGLVLGVRHSLLQTYLFYQTMGFLGTHAGETLAEIERGGREAAERALGLAGILGPIDVQVLEGEMWVHVGTHSEAGPLARQIEVLPFERSASGPVHIRLTASKGAHRLDWVALADLGGPVEPVVVAPHAVYRDGHADSLALALLGDDERHLVTYPGDTYDVAFSLPAGGQEWDLFLQSEGYYYEWMRAEWLADENAELAALVLTAPESALRVLAPAYKESESTMEELFWSSRFRR